MFAEQENIYYYITLMNENYVHPEYQPEFRDGILNGMYKLQQGTDSGHRIQLLGSGTILREVLAAAGAAARRLRHQRRRVERHQLQRAAARRAGLRALEHVTSAI